MHVLVVASYYPTAENPVTGIFIETQALMLHRAGHRVGVLVTPRLAATRETIRRDGLAGLKAVTRETYFPYDADMPVYRMHWGWFPRPLPPIVAPLTASAGAAAYRQYVKSHGAPDVLFAHNVFYAGFLAARLKRQFGVPAVLLEHSSSYREGRVIFPGQGRIARATFAACDPVMGVSTALARSIAPYLNGKTCTTLGNLVDTDFFAPTDPPPRPPVVFSWIAMFTQRVKRPDVLLKAFARVAEAAPDARLHLRGDGFMRGEIESQIAALGLGDRVTLLGASDLAGVRDTIRASHAVISSSDIETFGLTLAEAMACGVPVVATRSGGPEDFVTPDAGILTPPGDPEALAESMLRIIRDYGRFDRTAARNLIVERFSERALIVRLEAAFQAAIQ
ncbi:MAG: glycosyltransferase [Chloroflexi bacterium]|nr:glycosyltransferase [Chloroflexota bacterium]